MKNWKLRKSNSAPPVYWKHGTTQTSAQNASNQWKVVTSATKTTHPSTTTWTTCGKLLVKVHQKQPSTDKNTSPITMGEMFFTAAEGQHSSSEDTNIHSTSPRRLSDMSELSDQRGSTTEAAFSSSPVLLTVFSDASYLNRPNSGSTIGGLHTLSYHSPDKINASVHAEPSGIPVVVSLAGEAELSSAFGNAEIAHDKRTILRNLGYPLPPFFQL
jgi:hypothetical protein